MANKIWSIWLDGIQHKIELEHGYWLGKRILRLDNREILNLQPVGLLKADLGSRHPFTIDEHECEVVIRTNGVTYSYELEVDGRSLATGAAVNPFDRATYPAKSQERINRIVVSILAVILGIGGLIFNYSMAHSKGFYSPNIGYISSGAIVFGIAFGLFFKDTRQRDTTYVIVFSSVVLILCFLAAILNEQFLLNSAW